MLARFSPFGWLRNLRIHLDGARIMLEVDRVVDILSG